MDDYRRHRRGDSRWEGYRGSTKFVFFVALITDGGLCEKEVRRRIAVGKCAMGGLTSIWKDRGVTLETKVKLVKVFDVPGCTIVERLR